jgi:hypothetical protein
MRDPTIILRGDSGAPMPRLIVFEHCWLCPHSFACMGGLEARRPVLMLIVTEGRPLCSIF